VTDRCRRMQTLIGCAATSAEGLGLDLSADSAARHCVAAQPALGALALGSKCSPARNLRRLRSQSCSFASAGSVALMALVSFSIPVSRSDGSQGMINW
jgi:hypothetical protein